MIKLFIEIITAKSGKSHKRFISMLGFPCLIACLIVNCFGLIIQPEIILVFGGIVLGESGLTMLEKKETEIKNKKDDETIIYRDWETLI